MFNIYADLGEKKRGYRHSFKKEIQLSGVVTHYFNASTWESEVGRSLWFPGQPDLQSEL